MWRSKTRCFALMMARVMQVKTVLSSSIPTVSYLTETLSSLRRPKWRIWTLSYRGWICRRQIAAPRNKSSFWVHARARLQSRTPSILLTPQSSPPSPHKYRSHPQVTHCLRSVRTRFRISTLRRRFLCNVERRTLLTWHLTISHQISCFSRKTT